MRTTSRQRLSGPQFFIAQPYKDPRRRSSVADRWTVVVVACVLTGWPGRLADTDVFFLIPGRAWDLWRR
jgi:hypothetical protein